MAIPDDVKRQALEAAQNTREQLKEMRLPQGVEASSADVDNGPTSLDHETRDYGRNFNPVPEPEPPAPAPEPAAPAPEPSAPALTAPGE